MGEEAAVMWMLYTASFVAAAGVIYFGALRAANIIADALREQKGGEKKS